MGRARATCSRSSASRSRPESGATSSRSRRRTQQQPRVRGRPTDVGLAPGRVGRHPVPGRDADGTASYVADPTGGAELRSRTWLPATPRSATSRPRRCRTRPACSRSPTNTTSRSHWATRTRPGNGTFQLAFNGPDPSAYFPSTYSYILAQTTGFDPGKGATLASSSVTR